MKYLILIPLMVAAGLATGGGAAFGVGLLRGSTDHPATVATAETEFVPTGAILVPLTDAEGGLAGYATIEVQLEVAKDEAEGITARLPLLLNALNLHTYRAPLASGPDRLLPDLVAFRGLVTVAASEVYGKGAVRRVAVTSAKPA